MSPSRSDTTSVQLAEQMRQVGMLVQRRVGRRLQRTGMSPARMRVLSLLAKGPMRMSRLSIELDVAPRTITDVVMPMERDGLVVRRPDPADRRATLVELAEPGRKLMQRTTRAFAEAVTEVFGVLDVEQRRQLIDLLATVATRQP
jgi:DNA-binding MarR family transcriptional regulator